MDWRVVTALVVTVAIVFGALAQHAGGRDARTEEAARSVQAEALDPGGQANAKAAFDRTVGELTRYVESARGLTFKNVVPVKVLEDADFDPAEAEADDAAGVAGFYEPSTKELYVRGFGLSPLVKFVLVHELTHALQDQHFDLNRAMALTDDVAVGALSVIEGDAERVARGYLSTLGPFEQDIVQREVASMGGDMYAPAAFYLNFTSFPYVIGKMFVTDLIASGGQVALDRAFTSFPASAEQIIHIDRYLAGDTPESVGRPSAGGAIVDEGVIGEFELIVILGQVLDGDTAFSIGQMWGGSRYVTWLSGGKSCTRLRLVMEGAGAAERTAQALAVWAEASPGATANGTLLTTCR